MSRCSMIEVLVGIFVSGAVIAIGSFMVNRLSNHVKFYNRCTHLTASFSDVNGLKIGSEVRLSGVNIGNVTSLRLDSYNNPVVAMCIQKSLSLPADSAASITYDDLLGTRYIDIMPGADENTLGDGANITRTSTSISLKTIIAHLTSNYLK